ncbi:S1 RNA-binding domain-containing protein [Amycolatopsis pigmentata]|uniref:S1 RNA-binding domain-containing protein n=1 Tax=Amycolatopsis pigmentata TaxID=450801 RepID=A0ABW5G232_9PSEU
MSESQISPLGWKQFLAEHGDGGVLTVRVTKVLPFGALLEAAPGIHGLLPRSAWSTTPETGSAIPVRIANLDVENRRMSFTPA